MWHHIVEQRESLIQRFGAENIHNANNMVNVPAGINQKIADYYSSVDRRFHPTLTVRKWLETQSYEEQYAFGVIPLQRFLSSPRRRRKDPLMTYVEGALENGLALETGDVKGSKRSARKINQALKELAEDRSGLIEPLRTLLRHESHWVRGIAASDLLYVDQEPIEAVRVLEAIGSDVTLPFPGRIGASYAVKEWREGKRGPHAGGHPILTK